MNSKLNCELRSSDSRVIENFLMLTKTVIRAILFCSAYFVAFYIKIRIDSVFSVIHFINCLKCMMWCTGAGWCSTLQSFFSSPIPTSLRVRSRWRSILYKMEFLSMYLCLSIKQIWKYFFLKMEETDLVWGSIAYCDNQISVWEKMFFSMGGTTVFQMDLVFLF